MLSVDDVLTLLYKEFISKCPEGMLYAVKGGFILSRYYFKESRCTSDIGMSIEKKESFDLILNILSPLLEKLKSDGEICKYIIKRPKAEERKSGCIKLYRKRYVKGVPIDNQNSVVFCGIDVSVHDLSFGVSLLYDNTKAFSVERMLSDKIAVLYSNEIILLRRCRDLYDIYLFNTKNMIVSSEELKKCLGYRNIDISKISVFESMVRENNRDLYERLSDLLDDGQRVKSDYKEKVNLMPKDIIINVLNVLDKLRSSL